MLFLWNELNGVEPNHSFRSPHRISDISLHQKSEQDDSLSQWKCGKPSVEFRQTETIAIRRREQNRTADGRCGKTENGIRNISQQLRDADDKVKEWNIWMLLSVNECERMVNHKKELFICENMYEWRAILAEDGKKFSYYSLPFFTQFPHFILTRSLLTLLALFVTTAVLLSLLLQPSRCADNNNNARRNGGHRVCRCV